MQQTPPHRHLTAVHTAKVNRRPPLAPIPPAVFLEAVYADGKPYEETAGLVVDGSDDDWDDAA